VERLAEIRQAMEIAPRIALTRCYSLRDELGFGEYNVEI